MDLDLEECTSKTPIGVRCQLKVAALTPTQNAVGLDEVNDKVARYSAKTKADLKDYLIVQSSSATVASSISPTITIWPMPYGRRPRARTRRV